MNLKFESKLVETITIRTPQSDIIKLILDEDGKHSGRATVVLYDTTGSYYWSAMGMPLKKFIMDTPTSYLIDKLFQTEANIPDDDGDAFIECIYKEYKAEIRKIYFAKEKKEREENRDLLRYAFDYLKNSEITQDHLYHNEKLSDLLSKLFNDNWYSMNLIPNKENHIYRFQRDGIEFIKTALKQQLILENSET